MLKSSTKQSRGAVLGNICRLIRISDIMSKYDKMLIIEALS